MGSPPDQLLQPEDGALDAGLRMRVVVLDAVQQLAQAPVRVRLRTDHHLQQGTAQSPLQPVMLGIYERVWRRRDAACKYMALGWRRVLQATCSSSVM